jgi:two-component system NtrC family response regulator
LAWYFINETSDRVHENWEMTDETMIALCAYNWPGNVRELRNTIRRACILAAEPVITSDLLPFSPPKEVHHMQVNGSQDSAPPPLWVIEKAHIEKVLEFVEGNKSRAAKLLEIDRKTLYTKLERYGINA